MLSREDLNHVLDHTRDLWEELRGQRIFVTGGTGFFGCWLLESLIWANEQLGLNARAVVLTRNPKAFAAKAPHLAQHPSVTLLPGNVRTFGFPSGTFLHVIHAATESSTRLNAEAPLLVLDTIVEGTRHTLDFASQCGAQKLLLTSSGAVYGRQPADMARIPEDYPGAPDPLDARSVYGEGKRLAEQLCALYAQQSAVQMKIARCFAFVGPYLPLDAHFAIGNFIRDGLSGGPIVVQGDGTPRRSYLYAADLAIWLWTILFRGASCHPYNVGSEDDLAIAELAQVVARLFKPVREVRIMKTAVPDTIVERYVPSTQRCSSELELRGLIGLREAIERTARWASLQ